MIPMTLSRSPWQLNNRWLLVALALVVVWLVLGSAARAAEPPPVKGFATAAQVDALSKELAQTKKRVAELEAVRATKPPCACGAVCPCSATAAAVPAGEGFHISPDGTVNVRHADGVYRAVPGAPRQTPPQASSPPLVCGPSGCYSPAAWSAPTYLPTFGTSGSSCPGGRCPLPR